MKREEIQMQIKGTLILQGLATNDTDLSASVDIRSGLGLDEFQLIELVGDLEETLGISIDTDEMENTQTVGQLIDLVMRNIG
jgi:acyl carrier protein